MKKLLAILCAISLMLAPITVHAQEIYGDGSADTTVTAHIDSQYCVLIPETIVADGNLYYFTASSMMLASGDTVGISVSGLNDFSQLPMTGGDGNAVVYFETDNPDVQYLGNGVVFTSFTNGETTATYGVSARLADAEQPGDYTGTVTFNIQLQHFE